MTDPATLPLPELESYHRFLLMRRLASFPFEGLALKPSAVQAFNELLEGEIDRLGAVIIQNRKVADSW